MKNYYIYILASRHNKALCIGVTSNLIKRIWEHKNKVIPGFTSKYNVQKLVYFEEFQDVDSALDREKLLKSWRREWKINLVARKNPNWYDLYYEITK
ncbi:MULTISPECIES: GIY-YIG nuclease family protein [Rickettsiales]|uniref:GIY-YIG nuclease family protein n=1 Tax=unclassified Wolbachia TaxID=2640676 RepID=UPI0020A0C7CE|nr:MULTISPECIES: GIY-YIG nuclease family protein [Rickettsiales]MBV2146532.1 GIY-YIG nuclease family protein [Wolbachia endosymbiont of Pissodes strobi]WMT85067.1 GIY-YIG nuclease family protein [Wolbachia endosymbiont of Listronotus oregonensis]